MKILGRFATSSKWQAGAIGIAWILCRPWLTGLGVTEDQFTGIWITILGLIGAQAVADFGKESQK